jgi:hypothetical protein
LIVISKLISVVLLILYLNTDFLDWNGHEGMTNSNRGTKSGSLSIL